MNLSRRELLKRSAAGFGTLAFADLLARGDDASPLAPRAPHHRAPAKRVIFLFMHGGPSAVDTFDYKPLLLRDDGKPLPFAKPRVVFAATNNLLRSPWDFAQHGQSGLWVSSLFPNVARVADELAVVKSLHGSNPAHGGACLRMHTGSDTFVRPSLGAWVSYGLGTENRNLPSFVTINPTLGHGGVQNFGAGFLPAIHQGTRIARPGDPSKPMVISNAASDEVSTEEQRGQLDLIGELGRRQIERTGPDPALEARLESFELAFRMQAEAPGVMDLTRESDAMKRLYGIGAKGTDGFGRQCLLARRFAEAGVRFIQVTHGYWDQHEDLKSKHGSLAAEVDRPIYGLLTDLKSRGLLDDTLVIWGGEFGRTPVAQGKNGRDHNPHGFTWWLAGGGVKGGLSYGETDDYGFYAARDKVHVHDLHATILHLLGLDHTRLTYRHAGRDFRLTDVEGHVVHDLMA